LAVHAIQTNLLFSKDHFAWKETQLSGMHIVQINNPGFKNTNCRLLPSEDIVDSLLPAPLFQK
jgi:hypothetical protein